MHIIPAETEINFSKMACGKNEKIVKLLTVRKFNRDPMQTVKELVTVTLQT
jgi:hypothetical protein